MLKLLGFNTVLLAIVVAVLIVCKKYMHSDYAKNRMLLGISLATVLCHYSSLVYHQLLDGSGFVYLKYNPNLILPIYPCNVVMVCCVILGLMRNKNTRAGAFLVDYIFWFGIVSTLVGMFANVDFIRNPTLADFDVTKGILSHALLMLNVLLLPTFGYVKINLGKNLLHIFLSIVMMLCIGLYCNLVFEVIASPELAYEVNSMFLLHSPFEDLEFLTYPSIAGFALIAYFVVFHICELFAFHKGERWYNRLQQRMLDCKRKQ